MNTFVSVSPFEKIVSLSKTPQGAFPYEECQELAQKAGVDYQRLVSDLDTYFYDVWSAGNGVKKLARKPSGWLADLKTYLEHPFFVQYVQYASLEAAINLAETPGLFRRLAAFDTLRGYLVVYLSELLSESETSTKTRPGTLSV